MASKILYILIFLEQIQGFIDNLTTLKEYYFAHPEMQNSRQENSEENYF